MHIIFWAHTYNHRFLQLNLSGNPMGGEGLIGLCEGLRDCITLKIISLASINLLEQDNLACEVSPACVSRATVDTQVPQLPATNLGSSHSRSIRHENALLSIFGMQGDHSQDKV